MDEDERARHYLEKQLDYLHVSARSYDAKAQIASVGYLLTIGVIRLGFEAQPGEWAVPRALISAFGLFYRDGPVRLVRLRPRAPPPLPAGGPAHASRGAAHLHAELVRGTQRPRDE